VNTILRGTIDLLSDAVEVADPRLPAEFSGSGGSPRIDRELTSGRKAVAVLFLAGLALLPLLVMALILL